MDEQLKFVKGLYDNAEEETKGIYKQQKKARDELLNQIALVMLTYTVIDGVMRLSRGDKIKEYSRLSKLIKSNCKATGKAQEDIINNILTKTANDTFDFYSYNKGLKDVQAIIDKNFKGKHFSERVWENENQVASHLHKQVNDFLQGKVNVNQIKRNVEKTYNTSAYNAKRLVETEVARVENDSFKRFCNETGVKKVRRNAVLDNRTCNDCSSFDGKVYDLRDAPDLPAHPLCRCFYEIVDGESQYTLNEKRGKDIDSKVNWDLINSEDYKEKFKGIGKNSDVDNEIYNVSRRILKHRDYTKFEDLYIIDLKTGKTITYVTQNTEMGIKRTDKLEKILTRKNKDYMIIHNHPHSSPFSESDLKTLFNSKSVNKMMAVGHDGTVYTISSKNIQNDIVRDYRKYYNVFKKQGFTDYTSINRALIKMSEKYLLKYERR